MTSQGFPPAHSGWREDTRLNGYEKIVASNLATCNIKKREYNNFRTTWCSWKWAESKLYRFNTYYRIRVMPAQGNIGDC